MLDDRQPISDLKAAHRDWNRCYVIRQRQKGVPNRRTVAESILRAVMTAAASKSPMDARDLLRMAGIQLRFLKRPDGTDRYSKEGILHRWTFLHKEFENV